MLYLYLANERRLIDKSEFELEIINTIGEYISEDPTERFLVIEKTKQGDNTKAYIRNLDDYLKYAENYKLRQESCVELKRNITKNVKVKTKGSRKN